MAAQIFENQDLVSYLTNSSLVQVNDQQWLRCNLVQLEGEVDPPIIKDTSSEESDMEISTEILCMFFLIFIAISAGHFLKKSGHKYLQEAGLTTVIGILAGVLLKSLSIQQTIEMISKHFVNLFMIVLLPPIIFESGYNMSKKPFLRNIGTIIAYSFLGTAIAIVFSSLSFYFCGQLGWSYEFTANESWTFGSLISATDPVAVLAIFKQMDADENLYAIVFGESIFNDAIGIVMYNTVRDLGNSGPNTSQVSQLSLALSKFFIIFFGSLIVGAMTALITAFILKRQAAYSDTRKFQQEMSNQSLTQSQKRRLRQKNYEDEQNFNSELSIMLLSPYICYLISEGLQLSGIVSILINGIFLNYYGTPNVTRPSKKVIKIAVDTLAYLTESMVFLFLGIGIVAMEHPFNKTGWGTIILTLVNLNLARFFNIFIVTKLVNLTRSNESKIGAKQQFVMWIAGLRGAMAYALALDSSKESEAGKIMLLVTLIYALFTILGISSILYPVMMKCEVTNSSNAELNDP
mmetsp:Transcript_8387/g.14021  ORF Transcript_8387/g.14021 Transcript_8387/m.14021 type:complete len:519 (-) Transcript_8387:325-1881(-)